MGIVYIRIRAQNKQFSRLLAEVRKWNNRSVADDIYQNLLRILRYESKDTTYKFALLRGLIEISSESLHLIEEGPHWVRAPFGLLVEKWVQYYWPIVEQDIPQKHGGEKTKPLAFRTAFKQVTDIYSRKGGFTQFRHDYHNGRLTLSNESQYLALLLKLRQTIALMPMKHLGQSVCKELYGIVKKPQLIRVPRPDGELKRYGSYNISVVMNCAAAITKFFRRSVVYCSAPMRFSITGRTSRRKFKRLHLTQRRFRKYSRPCR